MLITTTDEVLLEGSKMISSDGIRGYNDAIILSILKKMIPMDTKFQKRFVK